MTVISVLYLIGNTGKLSPRFNKKHWKAILNNDAGKLSQCFSDSVDFLKQILEKYLQQHDTV